MSLNERERMLFRLGEIAGRSGVKADATEDFVARAEKLLGPDGLQQEALISRTVDYLRTTAPHLFTSGGQGTGPGGGSANAGGIPAGDPVAFGQHLEAIAKGEVRVAR